MKSHFFYPLVIPAAGKSHFILFLTFSVVLHKSLSNRSSRYDKIFHFRTNKSFPAISYSNASIIEAASGSTVSFFHQSKQEFDGYQESNFLVMPDGKTIVGRDAGKDKKLVAEEITSNTITEIRRLSSTIKTVLYDPKTRSLFAGDGKGHLHQYHKTEDTTSFTLVKDHGDIGLDCLRSSALVGEVAIFGGSNSRLVAVDIPSKELLIDKFKTAFRDIYFLQACEVSKSSIFLSVGGYKSSYSNSLSDIFEVETKEEAPASTISTETETHQPKPALIPDLYPQYSEKMVKSLLSDIFAYVDVLFRNFTRQYEARLQQTRGKSKSSPSNQSRISESRKR